MESIEVNFIAAQKNHPHNNRHQVLQKYSTALRQFRSLAEQLYRVRPFYFDNYVLFQYFQQRSNNIDETGQSNGSEVSVSPPLAFLKLELLHHILDRRRQILYWIFYLSLAFLCVFVYRHDTASLSTILSSERSTHTQPLVVYPAAWYIRRMSLPLIQRFPRLTELHDESCLMENPFFQLEDLSCEPCAHVENVLDLTQTEEESPVHSENEGAAGTETYTQRATASAAEFVPFVFKIKQTPIQLDDFYNIYASNHEIFQRDAYRVQSTNRDVTNLEELFTQFNHTQKQKENLYVSSIPTQIESQAQTHNMWRCNRMLPARLLRQLFPRPERLPSTGIALERYMAIDTPQAPAYTLPQTDCANVFVQQMLGTRFIILRPTSECRQKCRTLSMRLPQSFVLSYNWWYWKPISAPDPVSDTNSISLIGSYC